MRTTVPAKLNFPVPIPLSKLSPDDEQNQQDIFINKRFVLKKRFILLQGILNLNNTKHPFIRSKTRTVTRYNLFYHTLILRAVMSVIMVLGLATLGWGQSSQTFTSNGTFTLPSGVTGVTVELWGGGGGGGGCYGGAFYGTGRGGGGAGGAFVRGFTSVSANETVTVGAGGAGGSGNNNGTTGGSSSFLTLSASGGAGGSRGDAGNGTGGGTTTGNPYNGGAGSAGSSGSGSGAGGGGAGNYGPGGSALGTIGGAGGNGFTTETTGGIGAAGRTSSYNGLAATALSAGGGGGFAEAVFFGETKSGGNGYRGQVIVYYYQITSMSAITPICQGDGSTVTVNGASLLANKSYTVTYSLSGGNTYPNQTASMSGTTAGTRTFTIPSGQLSGTGTTTVTVTKITDGIYEGTIGSGNTTNIVNGSIISLTSGTQNQTVCSGTAITSTVYTFGGSATNATVSNLPAGLSSDVNTGAKTVTISGTPTASGTYTITTSGHTPPCTAATIQGTITVNAASTISLTSGTQNQTVCPGTAITSTVYTFGGSATNATVSNLPAGLSSNVDTGAKTVTISGSPTAGGTYTISTSGHTAPCTAATIQGTITVTAAPTITTQPSNSTICMGASTSFAVVASGTNLAYQWQVSTDGGSTFNNITSAGSDPVYSGYSTSATLGLTGVVPGNNNYRYRCVVSNNCAQSTPSSAAMLTVETAPSIVLTSAANTNAQKVCINSPITNITYAIGGGATGATITGLPSGVNGSYNSGVFTISGTPNVTAGSPFNYTVTTTGSGVCAAISVSGSITVNSLPTPSIAGPISACKESTGNVYTTQAGMSNYVWTVSAGGSITSGGGSTDNTATITWNTAGSQSVSVNYTDANGCSAGTTTPVTVNVIPTVQGITICQGGYGTLTSMSCGSGGTTSTGATYAGTGANITGVGNYSWSNPERILADDNSVASVDVRSGRTTNYLRGTNFGFSIPAGATINGIVVSIGRYSEGGTGDRITDYIVRLVKGGTITGNNKANAGVNWPTNEAVATYGSSTDLWNETWLPSDINASNFGVVLSVGNTNSWNYRMAYVDYIRITVTYTTLPELTSWYTVPSGGTVVHSGSPFNPIGDPEVIAQGGIYANLGNTNTPGTYPFYAECTNMPGCRARADFVINPKPTATILPDPAVVCVNQPLHLSVNMSGGGGTITTHNWWGTGGVFLSATDIPNPVFNSDYAETLNLTYNFTDINGCTGSDDIEIIVNPNNTVTDASSSPSPCIGTAMTPITHTTTGATGIGTPSGLPAGVSAAWASHTITISGTPTASGTFNYTIPLTGGCGTVNASGTINVKPINTVSGPSPATSTLCINTPLNPAITHTTTGATGIGTATGLPAGMTASWSSNTITISGTPTASGIFHYSIPLTGGCGNVSASGTITVTPNNTAGAASSTPSLCINTALNPVITHTTTGATGIGTPTGLPAGISAAWASNSITISGTPTTAGTFNYSIPLTGGCGSVNATGTITVNAVNTVTAASHTPTVCVGTVMTSIIHTTTGATGIGTPVDLPAGVTAEWKLDRITINGTPTVTGTFNYVIPLTGGCGSVSATGTITVTPNMTVTGPSAILPVCVNSALTPITHTTTGATGIGSPTGLPAGVSASWAANSITISGTPSVAGTYNYSIPLTGGCGPIVFATGTIVVNANISVGPASDTPVLCINTALNPGITHSTTGATGIGTPLHLPTGVSAAWASNKITITGTPTESGTFNYTIPLVGNCGSASATGTITVTPDNTVTAASSSPTTCINSAMTSITHTTTGATGIGTPAGLPAGVTAVWAANTITISGTPTVSGSFNYTIPLTGGCGTVDATGTITVNEAATANAGSAMPDICQGQTSTALGGSVGGSATGGSWSSSGGGTFNPSANDLNATWTPPAGFSGSAILVLTTTGPCPSVSASKTIIVNPLKPVSLTISVDANPACAGSSVTFTATPTNGGTNPSYQWKLNGNNVGTNAATYTNAALANGDKVTCVLTSSETCTTGNPATSNEITMTVNNNLPVSVTIAADPSGAICSGTSVTFTATPTNGGTNPSYQWKLNGTNVGTNAATYTNAALANGDKVTCVLTSSETCTTGNPATSNEITMTVNSLPTASIFGATTVCQGASSPEITFSGSGGTTPYTFTYRVNSGAFLTLTTAVDQSTVTLPVPTATPGSYIYELVSVSDQYSCSNPVSSSVTVTINPKPFMNPVTNQVKCDGEYSNAISFLGTNVTTYHWTNNNPSIGIPASGTGDISSSLLDNTGDTPVVATFTVTPRYSAGGVDCDGSPITFKITVNPSVTPPTAITVSAGAEPVCQLTDNTTTTTYVTNASNHTVLTWSVSPPGAGTINPSGVMTWAEGFSGMATISVVASGCNAPVTPVTRTVNVVPTVSTPSEITVSAGTEPTCQITNGTTTTTYATMANNNTGFNWSVTPAEAGTINSSGVMTWTNGFSGNVIITVTANGCNGPSAPVTRSVAVHTLPTVAISYPESAYCTSDITPVPVNITGTGAYTGGNFSATPAGLTINQVGAISPSGSAAGTYTVTYKLPTAGCGEILATTTVTITALPTVSFNYAGNPFCNSVTTEQSVTLTGTGAYSGGTFSAPVGLTLNSSTGGITPSTSTPGTYTVTYSKPAAGGCGVVTATRSVTVTAMPVATFSYPSNTYCTNAPNPSPEFSGGVAGTFTASPPGLEFVSPSTGQIDLVNSKTGNYTVTNTVVASGGCPQVSATFNVSIVVQPTAAISYNGTPFCTSLATSQPVILNGTGVFTGGTFTSSPAGLSIDSSTGAITPSASAAGTYTVTYNLAVAGGCNPVTTTTQVTITLAPVATFSYPGSPFCSNAGLVSPAFSGGGVPGTFSAPPGLVLNSATGEIDVSSSIPGTYTIINTIAAANGCDAVTANTSVTIHDRPSVTVDYCSAESPKIRIQASGGTSYSWVTPPYQGVTADHIDVDIVGIYGVTVTNGSCVQTVYSKVNDELVINGDFELGPEGRNTFTSGYIFDPTDPDGYLGEGKFGIGKNAQPYYMEYPTPPYGGFKGAHDHTSGNGYFMIVDGTGKQTIVWEQTISVEPNTDYYFAAWALNIYNYYQDPHLQFAVNDTLIGTDVIVNEWTNSDNNPWLDKFRFYGMWNSHSATTAKVQIWDLTTGLYGNDFGLDDISFGSLEPPPSTLISATGSDNQSICVDTRLTDIIYSTYKASTATVTGLPSGVTASGIVSNKLTISGIPTEFGIFEYDITFSGCGPDFTKKGKITVRPKVTAGVISGMSPLCIASTATYSSSGTTGGTWSSTNPSIATVNPGTGLVTPVSQGTTDITYTVTSGCGAPVSSFKTLTVMPNASITSVTGPNTPLCIGGTTTYTANGVVLSGGTGTWSSSNTSVATVDNNGEITGVGAGTADITFTITGGCGGPVTASKSISVVSAGAITGNTPLCIGDITTYTSNGTSGGTWSSSNPAVAVVNASTGEITAISAGTVDISYSLSSSCGPVVSTLPLTVNPDGNPGTITGTTQVCIGVGTLFTTSGSPGGTWSSTDPNVATVNPVTGMVTGVDAGSCNIKYTLPSGSFCGANLTAMMPISVQPNASISSVTGTKDQICIGESTTFLANDVVLGGGTGAWESSHPDIASVDANGLVTGLSEGTSTITYTITGGCSGPKVKEKAINVVICRLHYRTASDGLWASAGNFGIWESSPSLSGPWTTATVPPTAFNSLSITVRKPHTVEVATSVPVAHTLIMPGGEVTINAGVTVENVGSGGASEFVIESESTDTGDGYGSLIVNGTFTGQLTYNLWVTNEGCYPDRAYILSSPVSGQTAGPLRSGGFNLSGIKPYNEGINDWGVDILNSDPLESGRGYAIYKDGSPGVVPFKGYPNAANISVEVASTYERYGWNSVGNPYTSALRIKDISGFIYHNMETNPVLHPGYGAIYMWNESICEFDVINYTEYNPDWYIPEWSEYYWGTVNYTTDEYVQVGQGFLVNIKWPAPPSPIQVLFNSGMQIHSPGISLKKATKSWPGITLVAKNGSTIGKTIITFYNDGTTGLDPGYDAANLPAHPFQLYTKLVTGTENLDLAIQTLPDSQYEQLVVPVGVDCPSGGEISFKTGGVILPDGLFPILEDRVLKTSTALKTISDSYTVTVPPNTYGTGRFYLRFSNVTPAVVTTKPAIEYSAWFADGKIIVFGDMPQNARSALYDMSGRKLGEYRLEKDNRNEIPAGELVTGVYLLLIQSEGIQQVVKVPVVQRR